MPVNAAVLLHESNTSSWKMAAAVTDVRARRGRVNKKAKIAVDTHTLRNDENSIAMQSILQFLQYKKGGSLLESLGGACHIAGNRHQ